MGEKDGVYKKESEGVCVCVREKERCFARKSRKSEREKEALQGFRFLLEIIFRKKYH